jgi:tetratricopeptide (TPR) repeat protein
MLAANPDQPKILHQLGLLAARERNDVAAIACLRRAIHLNSNNFGSSQWFSDLADVLARNGCGREAVSARLAALRLASDDAETYRLLGLTLHNEGRHVEAVLAYRESLHLRPGDANTIVDLGDTLHALGHLAEALEQYKLHQQLRPNNGGTYLRIGRLRASQREWRLALDAFRDGLLCLGGSKSDRATLHSAIGQVQVRLSAFDEAIASFRDALCIEPLNVETLRHLVCTLELVGKAGDAARAWLHLGVALDAHDRVDEAVAAYRQAVAREPRCLEALIRLGAVHMMAADPASAVQCVESAVAVAPDHVAAHIALGRALHQIGMADRGWAEFAWWCDPTLVKSWRSYEQPLWDGSSIVGRSLLLWAMPDYGLGDTIQLVRFALFLKRHGAHRVFIECQPSLVPLIARMPGVDRVVGQLAPLPPFDVHAPLMLVPTLDRQARESATLGEPYLAADEALTQYWHQRLGTRDGMTVGICWGAQSNRRDARLRSAPLTAFAPLVRTSNVRFVSLQLGPHADEAIAPPRGLRMEAVLTESSSIGHTAALISALDLVITVDTMIAHLAGALGRPVWTLLPRDADWKWHSGSTADTTRWYSTMRLFRQSRAREWSDVLERVREALADAIRQDRSRYAP